MNQAFSMRVMSSFGPVTSKERGSVKTPHSLKKEKTL